MREPSPRRAGSLTLTQGTTNHGGVSVNVNQGTLASGGPMQAANLVIANTGNVDTGNDATITAGGRYMAGNLVVSGTGASFAVGGTNLAAAPDRIGLSGGTVTVRNGGMPTASKPGTTPRPSTSPTARR